MRRILCIYLPNWPIQRLLVSRPELDSDRPIILHARDPRRGQLVATCNAIAYNRGVKPRMPLAEAAALAGEGDVLPADAATDLAALARLAEYCERFSPLVGWETVGETPSAPDFLFLDVTGVAVLFGGEASLTREVARDFAGWGYEVRVALASTVGAAWAQCISAEPEDPPLISLRVPAETVDLLAQLGVTRISQLTKLPRTSLRARFGERILLRIDQFLGTVPETIVAHRPPPEFIAKRELEYPAERHELVEHIVREMVEQMAGILAQRREGAMQLTCRFDCTSAPPCFFQAGLCHPSANPGHLWEVLKMQLGQRGLPGPVGRITLAAPLTAPLQNRQQELFGGNHQEAVRQLELLVDRLSNRLGPEAVLRPAQTADPVPERAVKYRPLIQTEDARRKPPQINPPSVNSRPLLLRFQPLALKVVSIVPDGPPISFQLQGRMLKIVHWWGPERIESGWWRGRSARRDYYRVETDTGSRYWLFRRLQDGRWYLQGEFA